MRITSCDSLFERQVGPHFQLIKLLLLLLNKFILHLKACIEHLGQSFLDVFNLRVNRGRLILFLRFNEIIINSENLWLTLVLSLLGGNSRLFLLLDSLLSPEVLWVDWHLRSWAVLAYITLTSSTMIVPVGNFDIFVANVAKNYIKSLLCILLRNSI